jgi:hypothetical protein
MLSLKDNTNLETEQTSSSKKKIDILTKPDSIGLLRGGVNQE